MAEKKNRSLEILPITLLILCVIIFYSKILYADKSLYGSDFLYYFYPIKKFIRDCLSDNIFPFWNPFLFSGSPFIANIQASMFYPLGFFYYIFQPETAYTYSTMIHCMLGAIFMYLFMRSLLISRMGSFFSALVFMFNGYFVGHLYAGHLSFVQNYIWMPLIFLFLLKFLNTIDFKNAIYAGLLLGVQILGGFPQIAFYTILGIIALGSFYLISKRFKELTRIALGLGIIILIGFSLSAIQIMPTLEFLKLSNRAGGVSYSYATYDSLHPKELLTFLLPNIFGNVIDGTYWRTHEGWHFWEACVYGGILPLFLVFFKPKKEHLERLWLFFTIIIFISLFLALGKYNPFYPIIYMLPGFNSFRIPAQIIYLYIFSIAVLSGLGMARLEDERVVFNKASVISLTLIGVILIISMGFIHWVSSDFFHYLFKYFAQEPIENIDFFSLYERTIKGIDKAGLIFFAVLLLLLMRKNQKINFRIFNTCLLLLILIDLGEFGWEFIQPYDYTIAPEKQRIADKLNINPFEGRAVALTPFDPNDGLTYEIPSILGYDPLILKKYLNYIQTSQNWPLDNGLINLAWINNPDVKLLKMLNVRKLIYMDKEIDIENDVPYVNFIKRSIFKNEDEILSFMQGDAFDPKKMVVFDNKYRTDVPMYTSEDEIKSSYSIIEYNIDKISIKAFVDKPSYMVLSEIFYPGWHAKVDGKDVPVLRGNYIFRVIPINEGVHEIYIYFVSWPFRIGIIISLISVFISLNYLIYRKAS